MVSDGQPRLTQRALHGPRRSSAESTPATSEPGLEARFSSKSPMVPRTGDLSIAVEHDPVLFNQYGIMLVNPGNHPHVKAEDGQALIDWIVSATGQAAINAYRIKGKQAFFANAVAKPASHQ